MPLTTEREELEHQLRVELMGVQIELFKTQVRWEPWKAMATAAAAGAGVTLALVGIATALLRVLSGKLG